MKKLFIIPLLLLSLLLTWCTNYPKKSSENMWYMHCWNENFISNYTCVYYNWPSCVKYKYQVRCFEYTKLYTWYFK